MTKRNVRNGNLLLTVGFVNDRFGYAAGTGGQILITTDGGSTWNSSKAPDQVVYEAAFADEKHGLIHTPHDIYTTSDGGGTWVTVPILSNAELKDFSHVLKVVALDASHFAIVLSRGNSSVYDFRLFLTNDGGAKWSVSAIPSTGLGSLSAHSGEYWFAGMEVIEKDKPGGGYVYLLSCTRRTERSGRAFQDGQKMNSPTAIRRGAFTGMALEYNCHQLAP